MIRPGVHLIFDSLLRFYVRADHHKTTYFSTTTNLGLLGKGKSYRIAQSNLRYMYWSPYQQLAHHAAAGCGLASGDLIGTGTISGEVSLS